MLMPHHTNAMCPSVVVVVVVVCVCTKKKRKKRTIHQKKDEINGETKRERETDAERKREGRKSRKKETNGGMYNSGKYASGGRITRGDAQSPRR